METLRETDRECVPSSITVPSQAFQLLYLLLLYLMLRETWRERDTTCSSPYTTFDLENSSVIPMLWSHANNAHSHDLLSFNDQCLTGDHLLVSASELPCLKLGCLERFTLYRRVHPCLFTVNSHNLTLAMLQPFNLHPGYLSSMLAQALRTVPLLLMSLRASPLQYPARRSMKLINHQRDWKINKKERWKEDAMAGGCWWWMFVGDGTTLPEIETSNHSYPIIKRGDAEIDGRDGLIGWRWS